MQQQRVYQQSKLCFRPVLTTTQTYTGPFKGNPRPPRNNPHPPPTSQPCLLLWLVLLLSLMRFCFIIHWYVYRKCFRCVSRSARHGITSGAAVSVCMCEPLLSYWEYGIWWVWFCLLKQTKICGIIGLLDCDTLLVCIVQKWNFAIRKHFMLAFLIDWWLNGSFALA